MFVVPEPNEFLSPVGAASSAAPERSLDVLGILLLQTCQLYRALLPWRLLYNPARGCSNLIQPTYAPSPPGGNLFKEL
jgi:hypothetical protein